MGLFRSLLAKVNERLHHDEPQRLQAWHERHVLSCLQNQGRGTPEHVPEVLQDWRHCRHQGKWCLPKGNASQVLPWKDRARVQRLQTRCLPGPLHATGRCNFHCNARAIANTSPEEIHKMNPSNKIQLWNAGMRLPGLVKNAMVGLALTSPWMDAPLPLVVKPCACLWSKRLAWTVAERIRRTTSCI